ncbi:PIN domain-like protein [Pisolithus marmoratus]|nr:PIN domain-like protein [Pisolithus marmoratus]
MHSVLNVFSWRRAGTGQSHEMQAIFCRLSAISRMLLHPYFIFDRPDCPQVRRGPDPISSGAPLLLVQRFQELLTAFGFGWHVAPCEAEAELAYFQSCGLVDAVVTPYNDALLYGARCIIRSVARSDECEDIELYTSDAIENLASLEWGDLLLIALMSSADNDVDRCLCSTDIACRLTRYGFGRTLFRAAITLQFVEFMEFVAKWRDDVCEVLKTDPHLFLGRRHRDLACVIKEERVEFPDPAILAMYLLPLTSWSNGGHPPVTVVTSRQPDLMSLAMFCSQRLRWPPDTVHSRLMDTWAGTAVRALLQVSLVIVLSMPAQPDCLLSCI